MAIETATVSRRNWINLPPLRPSTWLGARIDTHEIVDAPRWHIQIQGRARDALGLIWFASHDEAFTCAVRRTDRLHLLLFDLYGSEAD